MNDAVHPGMGAKVQGGATAAWNIAFTLNQVACTVDTHPAVRLSDLLRDQLVDRRAIGIGLRRVIPRGDLHGLIGGHDR